jgi:hypothetical protein
VVERLKEENKTEFKPQYCKKKKKRKKEKEGPRRRSGKREKGR